LFFFTFLFLRINAKTTCNGEDFEGDVCIWLAKEQKCKGCHRNDAKCTCRQNATPQICEADKQCGWIIKVFIFRKKMFFF
jgi:hypothetical protein